VFPSRLQRAHERIPFDGAGGAIVWYGLEEKLFLESAGFLDDVTKAGVDSLDYEDLERRYI